MKRMKPAGGAHIWTRITDRANALLWRMPLPHRVLVRLSLIIYRNPPMRAGQVAETLNALDHAGVSAVVIGGWGVDSLVGEECRTHRDLDLAVDHREMDGALEALRQLGYEEWYREESPASLGDVPLLGEVIVVRDSALRSVEVHPVEMSTVDLAQGSIDGRRVRCFSAEQQIRAHSGFSKGSWRERQNQKANLETAWHALGPSQTGLPD
jgi:lincosamide nucleotidyltransferase A/C/D/E